MCTEMAAAAGRAGLGLAGAGKVSIWDGDRVYGKTRGETRGGGTQVGIRGEIWAGAEACSLRESGDPDGVPGKGSKRGLGGVDPVGDPVWGSAATGKVGIQVGLGLAAVPYVRIQSYKESADKLHLPLFAGAGEDDGGGGVPGVDSLSLYQVENSRLGMCLTCTLHFYVYDFGLFLQDTIWCQLTLFPKSIPKACGKTCHPEAKHRLPDKIHVN